MVEGEGVARAIDGALLVNVGSPMSPVDSTPAPSCSGTCAETAPILYHELTLSPTQHLCNHGSGRFNSADPQGAAPPNRLSPLQPPP
jgi:hypothetical protein